MYDATEEWTLFLHTVAVSDSFDELLVLHKMGHVEALQQSKNLLSSIWYFLQESCSFSHAGKQVNTLVSGYIETTSATGYPAFRLPLSLAYIASCRKNKNKSKGRQYGLKQGKEPSGCPKLQKPYEFCSNSAEMWLEQYSTIFTLEDWITDRCFADKCETMPFGNKKMPFRWKHLFSFTSQHYGDKKCKMGKCIQF